MAFSKKAQTAEPQSIGTVTRAQERWADRTLKHLTLEEKIGQMIEVRGIFGFYNSEDPRWTQLIADIRKYHLGAVHLSVNVDGPLLLRMPPYEAAMTTNLLQEESRGKVPLIFSVDFERGPSMRLTQVEDWPEPMAFGATGNPAYEERFAKIVAEESRALGIDWNFYPIADVQINPQNPIINTRSYGEDPAAVSEFVQAYIKGSHEGGMLTTLKHFPGHGDTDVDSHLNLARVNAPLERLKTVELPPFQAGINAGTDAVMIAHVAFPALEPDPTKIATTSHKVVTGLLREQMGFKGVIVSDAMEMHGLTKLYPGDPSQEAGRAAVDTVKAGQDLLELPSDLEGTYNGLLAAVKSGEIPRAQIDASVRRILLVKAKAGLNTRGKHLVDLDDLQNHVGKPASYALAQEVADKSVTLVRDDNHLVPMAGGDGSTLVVIFVSDAHGDEGHAFERQLRSRIRNARVVYVDRRSADVEADAIAKLATNATRVIAAVFSVSQPGPVEAAATSASGLAAEGSAGILRGILSNAADKTVVVALGSPYAILNFPGIKSYVCTYSWVTTSERAAAKALTGEIAISGKLPVTLPGVAKRGDGMVVGVR
ncbi:MAG TPA: glycoside hydrolase family 3 protein [Acidobacteriaceae bacterium]|nr:glycoside hydrolase family 3 protein [Acidobacteriaceae bacterium]